MIIIVHRTEHAHTAHDVFKNSLPVSYCQFLFATTLCRQLLPEDYHFASVVADSAQETSIVVFHFLKYWVCKCLKTWVSWHMISDLELACYNFLISWI